MNFRKIIKKNLDGKYQINKIIKDKNLSMDIERKQSNENDQWKEKWCDNQEENIREEKC